MRLMSGRGVGECGSGRQSYGFGVISEVGWLSLCGAPPWRLYVAPCNLAARRELGLESFQLQDLALKVPELPGEFSITSGNF